MSCGSLSVKVSLFLTIVESDLRFMAHVRNLGKEVKNLLFYSPTDLMQGFSKQSTMIKKKSHTLHNKDEVKNRHYCRLKCYCSKRMFSNRTYGNLTESSCITMQPKASLSPLHYSPSKEHGCLRPAQIWLIHQEGSQTVRACSASFPFPKLAFHFLTVI